MGSEGSGTPPWAIQAPPAWPARCKGGGATEGRSSYMAAATTTHHPSPLALRPAMHHTLSPPAPRLAAGGTLIKKKVENPCAIILHWEILERRRQRKKETNRAGVTKGVGASNQRQTRACKGNPDRETDRPDHSKQEWDRILGSVLRTTFEPGVFPSKLHKNISNKHRLW